MLSGAFSKIGNTSHYIEILYQETRSSATLEKKFRPFLASLDWLFVICYLLFGICYLLFGVGEKGIVEWE
ncbi:hypothetical protein [Dactylococcopsis salina]|uniref:hypothetical protein n=1 Tax=Dactylococcopsis salina TaxID=292566 RepID=UPI00031294B7|nr:hypothetical protein [Dactylococcopsis salina]